MGFWQKEKRSQWSFQKQNLQGDAKFILWFPKEIPFKRDDLVKNFVNFTKKALQKLLKTSFSWKISQLCKSYLSLQYFKSTKTFAS